MDASSMEPPRPASKPSFLRRVGGGFHAIAVWFSRFWSDIRPGPEARKGAVWGCLAAALASAVVVGRYMILGFGLWFDLLFCIVVGALLVLICIAVLPLILTILRKLPRLVSAIILGSGLTIFMSFGPVGPGVAPIACLSAGIFGATVATLASSGFGRSTLRKKIATWTLLVLSAGSIVGELIFLARDGTTAGLMHPKLLSPAPPTLRLPNPGESGAYDFRVLYYGTKGGNPRRPEYNNSAVSTPTVDASRFFKDFKGWKRSLRKFYWGYDLDKLPLNATVWIPQGPGPFPLALIVHGNHSMAEFSEPGYRYLGELLSSRGIILASVDENFLNSGLFHDPPNQQAVRGWMLLEHLKLWKAWSVDAHNPIGVKIDFSRIALMGHSRGGEAAATAAFFNQITHYPDDARISFDYHYPILSVVAIAPADGQYKPAGQPRPLENVSYFTIQGANDADVSSFSGSRQWDRVRYTKEGDWFKSELYIYRANHGQFNTVWGRSDAGYPLGWFLNLKPLMNPEDQRRIARIYLSAFLEATLLGKREYLPLFHDYRCIRDWLPNTIFINRYQDTAYKTVADFSEDPDVSTATLTGARIEGSDLSIWREGRIPFREGDRGYNGVFLGWNHQGEDVNTDAKIKPVYTILLPENAASIMKLTRESALTLSLATLDEDAPRLKEWDSKQAAKEKSEKPASDKERPSPDFTVELETSDGIVDAHPLSNFGTIPPPVKVRFTKLEFLDKIAYEKSSEPVFQTIRIPLSNYAGKLGFDIGRIKAIRLRFDRTAESVILLSKVGFD